MVRFLAVGLFAACSGVAQVATLQQRPDLQGDRTARLPAFPRVVAGDGVSAEVAAAINETLQGFEADLVKRAHACVVSEGGPASDPPGSFVRTIRTTMVGPWYLSFFVADSLRCSSLNPIKMDLGLVFDLTTGQPIDWKALLPRDVAVDATPSWDGLPIHTVQWAAMLPRAKARATPKCRAAYDDKALSFFVTLSASTHSMVLTPVVTSHHSHACTVTLTIPASEAKRLGVAQPLVDALLSAK